MTFSINILNIFIALLLFSAALSLNGEELKPAPEATVQPDSNSEVKELLARLKSDNQKLKIEDAVKLVIYNNNELRLQQLELLKADSVLDKEESKYAPLLGLKYQGLKKIDEPRGTSVFQGTKLNSDTYAASISKLFQSGTYFQLEASRTRFDSNAGEGLQYQGTFAEQFAEPPLYTGELKVVLRQELVKNSFGYSQRRINEIARNAAIVQREKLTFAISQMIVKTMVDYWMLAISEENLRTAEVLLKNSKNILAITGQKKRIGLAESFEVNQWRALVSQSEARVEQARLERDNSRRNILRSLNLPPGLDFSGETELESKLPELNQIEQDLATAIKTRPDLRSIEKERENAQMALELANNNLLPSVTLGGSFIHRDLSENPNSAFREVPPGRYPEYGVEFKVEYPLGDSGARADVRDAQTSLKQIRIKEKELRRQIEDEIHEGADRIRANHLVLEKSSSAYEETRSFYSGLLRRYRQGRFNANTIKNALDSLAQSSYALMQARINFNISLIRYEMARHTLFSKFNIDIDEVLSRVKVK